MALSCNFCGLALENPFVLASAPPTASIEMINRAFVLGWAGAVTKTIKPDHMVVEDASPRFHGVRQGNRVIGLENFELVSKKSLEYWKEGIAWLRKKWPEKVLIVSIMGDARAESWQELAGWAESAGAQALELNFSCPHGMPEKGVGAAIGQNPEFTRTITSWVRAAVQIPVMVKLTPNVTSVTRIAQAALEGGADALAAINTVESLMGVDLDTLTPRPMVSGHSTYGGYSGPGVKPIGLRVVSQLSAFTDVPISGMGGVSTWQDAMEYMSLGANHVQVCTEVMVSGYGIIKDLVEGTREWMARMGHASLDDIRGIAARKLTSHEALVKKGPLIPVVNHDACSKCGACVRACRDGAYQAISVRDRKIHIDPVLCDGCGLCTLVCPDQAISQSDLAPAANPAIATA